MPPALPDSASEKLADDALCVPWVVEHSGVEGFADKPAETKAPSTQGLSPYMLFKNQYIRSKKQGLGGRTLSEKEREDARAEAKSRWETMDQSPWKSLYAQRREGAIACVGASAEPQPPYQGIWGGGRRSTPCSPKEMWELHAEVGWPDDGEVHGSKTVYLQPDTSVAIGQFRAYNCYGCARSVVGVCRNSLRDPDKFTTVEAGLNNYLSYIPKAEAEGGAVFLMFEGVRSDGSVGRALAFVCGVTWSPKGCDLAYCAFRDKASEHSQPLELPFLCHLTRRQCLIIGKSEVLDIEPSGCLIDRLCAEFHALSLYALEHQAFGTPPRKNHTWLSTTVPETCPG